MSRNSQLAAVARVLIAALFLYSAIGKIAAPEATQGYIAAMGLPLPLLSYLAAIAVELGGAVLLIVGYQTRIVSVIVALFTLATAAVFHHNFADQNQMAHFMKNVAIAGGLLQMAAFGAGAFSIDGRLGAMPEAATAARQR